MGVVIIIFSALFVLVKKKIKTELRFEPWLYLHIWQLLGLNTGPGLGDGEHGTRKWRNRGKKQNETYETKGRETWNVKI